LIIFKREALEALRVEARIVIVVAILIEAGNYIHGEEGAGNSF
jgi:hypothetical protein